MERSSAHRSKLAAVRAFARRAREFLKSDTRKAIEGTNVNQDPVTLAYRQRGVLAAKAMVDSLLTDSRERASALALLAVTARQYGDASGAAELLAAAYSAEPEPERLRDLALAEAEAGLVSRAYAHSQAIASELKLKPIHAFRLRQAAGLARMLEEFPEVPPPATLDYVPASRSVLYVQKEALPFHRHGSALRTHNLIQALRQTGWGIEPAFRPGYPRDRAAFRSAVINQTVAVDQLVYHVLDGAHVVRMAPDDYLQAAADSIERFVGARRIGAIVSSSDPLTVALPASIAARRLGIPHIYDAHSPAWFQPEPSNEREELLNRLGTLVLLSADAVVLPTCQAFRAFQEIGVPTSRLHVIPDAPPPRRHIPTERSWLERHGLSSQAPTVGYFGYLASEEGIEDLLLATKSLMDEGLLVQLVISGEGPASTAIAQRVAQLKLEHQVRLTGYLDSVSIQALISMVDVVAIPRRRTPLFMFSSSQKLLEALHLGARVVLPDLPSLLEVAEKFPDTVSVFKANDVSALTSALRAALSDPPKRSSSDSEEALLPAWDECALAWGNVLDACIQDRIYGRSIARGTEASRSLTPPSRQSNHMTLKAPASPGEALLLRIVAEDPQAPGPKAIVAAVRYHDEKNESLPTPYPQCASSDRFPAYIYVTSSPSDDVKAQFYGLIPPPGAAGIEVQLIPWKASDSLTIRPCSRLMQLSENAIEELLQQEEANAAWLEPASKYAQARGSLTLYTRILERLCEALRGDQRAVKRLAAAEAELRELEPSWYPNLGVHASTSRISNGKLIICHLQKTAYPFENSGGAIRSLNTLLSQRAIGLDPYLITPPGYPGKSASPLPTPDYEVVEGIEHYRLGAATNGVRALNYPERSRLGAVAAARVVSRRGASLVHAASGVRGYELAVQALALRSVFDIPAIYEVRSLHEHTWTIAEADILERERTRLRILKENRCMQLADHVITISDSMRQILVSRGVPVDKIDVVPNAIDDATYARDSFPTPAMIPELIGANCVVGYVSNMSRREGHRYLIEAVAQLRASGRDVRCLLVGDGPERIFLERLAQELAIREFVVFAGEVDHRLVNSYYLAMDIFVVPRIPDYAADWVTPLKPYEAMALARPLIVSDLPALREVVDNGVRGLLAVPRDAQSLAKQIAALALNPECARDMGQRARKWVLENRTWKANARRYQEIYVRVLEGYRPGRPSHLATSWSSV